MSVIVRNEKNDFDHLLISTNMINKRNEGLGTKQTTFSSF